METTKNVDYDYYVKLFKEGKSYEFIKQELRIKGLEEEDIFNVIHVIDRQLLNETRKKAENADLLYYFIGGGLVTLLGLAICLNMSSFSIGRIVSYMMILFGVFAVFIGLNKRRK
jgi:hypothetical protein